MEYLRVVKFVARDSMRNWPGNSRKMHKISPQTLLSTHDLSLSGKRSVMGICYSSVLRRCLVRIRFDS